MIPNMKFYVISIVAIFAALGIGIFIGFTLDAQTIVEDQGELIALELEKRFDYEQRENKKLKDEINTIKEEQIDDKKYINNSYKKIIENRLLGKNAIIIETSSDYIYSGLGATLEDAGAKLKGILTIKENVRNIEKLEDIYTRYNIELEDNDLIIDISRKITNALLENNNEFIEMLKKERIIDLIGNLNIENKIDTIIIAGGSKEEENALVDKIDKCIIDISISENINIVGVEKSNVSYSYMPRYQDYNISTIDNIDNIIGKVSLVYVIDNRPGHYGTKNTADSLMPRLDIINTNTN